MESWYRYDITHAHIEGLIKHGLLRGRTDAVEWLVTSHEDAPAPPNSYIVSFALFHKRRLMAPPHPFF